MNTENTAENIIAAAPETSKPAAASVLIASMSTEELDAVAVAVGVQVGKTRSVTVSRLNKAIADGKAQVKMVCTVSFKSADGSRITYFGRTLRTYVSGPGQGNCTWLLPANAIQGWPSDPNEA